MFARKIDRSDLSIDVDGKPLSDPHQDFVAEAIENYPYRAEVFGTRSIIRSVVWTVLRMKEKGLI